MAVAAAVVAAAADAENADDEDDVSRALVHVVAETLFDGGMAAVNRFDCFCFLSNVGFVELELLLLSAN